MPRDQRILSSLIRIPFRGEQATASWSAPSATINARPRDWRKLTAGLLTGLILLLLALQAEVTTIRPDPKTGLLLLAHPQPAETDWPGYRGLTQQGQLLTPMEWLASKSAMLKTQWNHAAALSGSMPCTWGEQVFQLESDKRGGLKLACYAVDSGRKGWEIRLEQDVAPQPMAFGQAGKQHPQFTPACDGVHVYVPTVSRGELLLTAVSLSGRRAWTRAVGPYFGRTEYRVSPVIAGPLVIVAADQPASSVFFWQPRSYLAGVHRQTGEIIWRTRRPNGESYGVPVYAEIAGRPQLVLAGRQQIASYDPLSGQTLWTCKWLARSTDGSIVSDDRHVYVTAADPQGEVLCIRADGQDDVTATHLAWRSLLPEDARGALVLADPLLILQQVNGTIVAYDKATGRSVWRTHLPGTLAAPPLISDRHLICLDHLGCLRILDIDRRGDVLLESQLDGNIGNSLIVIGERLLIRSPGHLSQLSDTTPAQLVIEPRAKSVTK